MDEPDKACIFCEPQREILAHNDAAIAVFDSYPVSPGHAHIHVIPRYTGDTPNPKGGVRHVIPLKGTYPSA